jgi:RND family efflux transporter MFP subunit
MSSGKKIWKVLLSVVGGLSLIVLILYMGGVLSRGQIEPGVAPSPPGLPEPARTVAATVEDLPILYEAVGTIRSRLRFAVSAQVTGRIVSVTVVAGDTVKAGKTLVYIDDREFQARLRQALGALAAAEAAKQSAEQALISVRARFTRTEATYKRTEKYLAEKAATPQQMEAAEAEYRQAAAGVESARHGVAAAVAQVNRARQVVEEAKIALEYTKIKTQVNGVVSERKVDPGDLAWPGRPLLFIHDPKDLRLEGNVREGLIGRIRRKDRVRIQIASIDAVLDGVVDEIEPAADPQSRSFLVKVAIPATEGLYPGMFGKLQISLGTRPAILIPREAVTRVGQLETVLVREDGIWRRRHIKTGAPVGERIEVLSGLRGGTTLGLAKTR